MAVMTRKVKRYSDNESRHGYGMTGNSHDYDGEGSQSHQPQ
jgi:hypothetical protein